MVSRQETSRPLLTPGEVMQLPSEDELVLVSGCPPIRAKKARYYEDRQLQARILPPPNPAKSAGHPIRSALPQDVHDWNDPIAGPPQAPAVIDPDNGGIRREPELPKHEEIAPEPRKPAQEFEPAEDEPDDDAQRLRAMQQQVRTTARQIALDPGDGMELDE
jgi:type IV secretion system protein VirD4